MKTASRNNPRAVRQAIIRQGLIKGPTQGLAPGYIQCNIVHGAPIHIGHPELIGIDDINEPVQALSRTRIMEDGLPVFRACGVTSQLAVEQAKLPLCITHASAHMLITDLRLDMYTNLKPER